MRNINEIAILDFGSQYTHLIARRVRELGVISHIYPNDVSVEKLKNAVGIILSGGPRSVVRDPKLDYDSKLFSLNIPLLGLCYGHQLIADVFGGKLGTGQAREYGIAKMKISNSPIFQHISSETTVWMSHGDHVEHLPEGFQQIAKTNNDSITAMAQEEKKIYGFQFHPEVHHSKEGKQMLHNFVFTICRAEKNWTTDTMLTEIEKDIKKQAGDKNIFLLVSGGVDSTVCFALLEKVLGKERVYGLHVDHGLMRKDESYQVNKALREIGLDDLHVYDAEQEYLQKLEGIIEPEKKRKIIGDLFLDITDKIMAEKGMASDHWLIAQGTIYPDTIESGGTKNADVIKTHHNRVPRIQQMIAEGKIIEPIKELYKDEVREIGMSLGLPKELVYRHPFPGPGLGIRCLCSEGSNENSSLLNMRETQDFPFLQQKTIYKLPLQSVGVQGDERSYAHPALLIPEQEITDMLWEKFRAISPDITNTFKDINRVLFLLEGNKEKIQESFLQQSFITKKRLDLLREIDAIVNKHILQSKECDHIWQLPVVLIPFGYEKKESIVLRPVESEEAMTVSFAKIPQTILQHITENIQQLSAIDFIFYDITNKPPATIEWE